MTVHVFPAGHVATDALVVHCAKRASKAHIIDTIAHLVGDKRPQWGRATLKVLEYGGGRSWTLDWNERRLR